jgi:RNA polymerase sigma factor (sigma-70 family)
MTGWDDPRLIRECLKGNEEAWNALVEKYKRLVYAIPVRQGLADSDAADIFQEVFLELIAHLGRLRDPKALAKWLIQTASHKCYHHKKGQRRETTEDPAEVVEERAAHQPDQPLREWQEEQALLAALASLPARCRTLVEMLFFESPPRPYQEVAARLGIAPGSIGFIRGRCLKKLKQALDAHGFSR